MILGDIADGVARGVETATGAVSEAFFDQTLRLGVTGLSRAGKTVFITSLVANLLNRARMPGLAAVAQGRILAAYLQPQPDDTVPRFSFESHLASLTGPTPHWPEGTRAVSQLRLSLRYQPGGLLAGIQGPRTLHLDIVDYPGEWLLDLKLLDQSYAEWSAEVLLRIEPRAQADGYRFALAGVDGAARFDEAQAQVLAQAFTDYLNAARADGFSDCTPGRFLLPGELAGSPALTFAPLPQPAKTPRRSLWTEMERRFEAYKRSIVKPFFRDHFARIDRQVVLIDALGAIHSGPQAVEDMRRSMAEILGAFRPGRNGFLRQIFLGKRVEKLLFCATKADHLHHAQHGQLSAILEALVQDAKTRADFAGAGTGAMAIAALRTTVEEQITHQGAALDCVRGTLVDGRQAAFYPGALPQDPSRILAPARDGAEQFLDADYQIMRFAPAALALNPGEGPPHIRLDRAAQFLIGDRL